jgi:hypothetical protein
MGTYFNPPKELPKVARRLFGNNYENLTKELKDGEHLFGYFDRGIFQNAVNLFSGDEFEEFHKQVRAGQIALLGYYAMPDDVFQKRCH